MKISYKHVSDFLWIRSYGHFVNSHTHPVVNRVGASWWVTLVAYRFASRLAKTVSRHSQLAQFTTERQYVSWPEVAFTKTRFKHRSIQIKGNLTKLILHLCFKCIMY
jgi:hypothetical protein